MSGIFTKEGFALSDEQFVLKGMSFPNLWFDTEKLFDTMRYNWITYSILRSNLAYSRFLNSKKIYGEEVKNALKNSTLDKDYVKNSDFDATTYQIPASTLNQYGGLKNKPMQDAWNAIDLNGPIDTILSQYISYLSKRISHNFGVEGLIAVGNSFAKAQERNKYNQAEQNKQAETLHNAKSKDKQDAETDAYNVAKKIADTAARDKVAGAAELAASDPAAAAEKAAAKTAAKKKWEDAEADAAAKLQAWDDRKKEYTAASNAVPPLQLVYDNAQKAADNAKTKKAEYDDALAQQTAANVLLTSATNELSKINTKRQETVNKTVGEDSSFLKDAASFPNTTFGTDKEYNAMTADWAAYTAAKTALAATDSKKIVDVTAATDKLVETYNNFIKSKGTYGASVMKALTSNNTDREYVKNSKNDMDTYGLIYDITKEYNAMMNAWTKVTTSLDKSDVAGVINNYTAYVLTKTAFTKVLLIAQNKKAEANFQTNLAAGKDAAAKWLTGSAKGCRNIQTIATTDPNMLDQDIACNDTEYISGYNKVSGYDAAPVNPNLSRDNIAQYLAVKYSCCVAPEGAKGTRGKQGLPGIDGNPGSIGPVGPAGQAGLVGNKGESGDSGEEGGKGPRGDAGDNGINGEAGPPGKAGESVKVPYIRQVPGPMGQPGQRGPMGPMGPKGPDGVIKPAPMQPFSEVDRTIGLVNLQERINKYIKGI